MASSFSSILLKEVNPLTGKCMILKYQFPFIQLHCIFQAQVDGIAN